MSITRRDFLKYTSVAAAGSAALLSDAELFSHLFALEGDDKRKARYVPTYCEICFWNCGAVAAVVNGRVKKLEGNPYDPRSNGMLCARGNAGLGQLYDPDRLKHPMIRTGSRGDGKYKKASWDEALGFIAEKITRIHKDYGPESLAFLLHGGITSHLMTLGHALRTPNFAFPSFGQCRGARVAAYELTYGMDVGSPERVDMRNSKALVLIGTHLGENMHNSQVQDFSEAIGNRAKIIVVDPRFSTAAGKADYWLPIKPGTDIALLLSWINIIISEELYDAKFVSLYAEGFQELKQAVQKYTPEWAASETEIPAHLIVETAREMARYAPSVCIHPGRFTAWHGNDTQRSRCTAILGAILGTWGRKGGIYLPTKSSLPRLKGKPYPKAAKFPVTVGPHAFAKPQLVQALRHATISGDPYPVKGWIIAGTHILNSVPAPRKTLEAVSKLDLLVTVDVMPNETAMIADVILPESTYLERHDKLKLSKGRELVLTMRQPVVQPLYESKPGWWIARELAKRLGVQEYFPHETYEEFMKQDCAVMGVDYEELRKVGAINFPNTDNAYITDSNKPVFNTPSGKIELYSRQLKKEGYDPVPQYRPIRQPEKGWFRLIFGRSPVHSFSRTVNNQRLSELYPENEIWINTEVASDLGIEHGQYVEIVNEDGVRSGKILAKVTQRIRKDCVFMIHGFGSVSSALKIAYGKGAGDHRLTTRFDVDPISGSTGMRVNFVQIIKQVKNA